jgi:hypothetical protein
VIAVLARYQQVFWVVNSATSVLVLVLLAMRKNYRVYPAFAFYLLVNLASGATLFFVYGKWGYSSRASWLFAWGTQLVVSCARALAVAEVCRNLLARYLGIWALAKRIFVVCAALVLLYAGLAARHRWELALPNGDRAVELAVASVIVLLFLFARYYGLQAEPMDRSMAIGLCLYSCFRALNDTILERFLYGYSTLWSVLGALAFFASLCLWSWALRKPRTVSGMENKILPVGAYESIAPEINRRLRELNDLLSKIWKAEVTES